LISSDDIILIWLEADARKRHRAPRSRCGHHVDGRLHLLFHRLLVRVGRLDAPLVLLAQLLLALCRSLERRVERHDLRLGDFTRTTLFCDAACQLVWELGVRARRSRHGLLRA
jgi:hypothetical protein